MLILFTQRMRNNIILPKIGDISIFHLRNKDDVLSALTSYAKKLILSGSVYYQDEDYNLLDSLLDFGKQFGITRQDLHSLEQGLKLALGHGKTIEEVGSLTYDEIIMYTDNFLRTTGQEQ